METEQTRFRLGEKQLETAAEREANALAGKASAIPVGIAGMSPHLNMVMMLQVPTISSRGIDSADCLTDFICKGPSVYCPYHIDEESVGSFDSGLWDDKPDYSGLVEESFHGSNMDMGPFYEEECFRSVRSDYTSIPVAARMSASQRDREEWVPPPNPEVEADPRQMVTMTFTYYYICNIEECTEETINGIIRDIELGYSFTSDQAGIHEKCESKRVDHGITEDDFAAMMNAASAAATMVHPSNTHVPPGAEPEMGAS